MADENGPLATIIVTPRERFSTALRCLPNIVANTDTPHRLIYVAGKPPAYVARFLREICEQNGYELVITPDFLHPNAARNIGIQRATTKYVAFVDNDVVVEPGWLDALIRCAEETGADVVGPLCLYGEPDEGQVHTAGGDLILHDEGGRRWLEESHRLANIDLRVQTPELRRLPCDFVEMHCMFARRALFDEIGLMDEKIISAAEHLDIALLLKQKGGRTYTEPASVISYLAPAPFVLADAEFFALRWSDEWYEATIEHFARKFNLDRDTEFFRDYDSFTRRQQQHCGLPAGTWDQAVKVTLTDHPFAQTAPQLAVQMSRGGYPSWNIEEVLAAYQFSARIYSGIYRESGKTLAAHAVGTASVLAAHGAPATVVTAALLHAAYALGRMPQHVAGDMAASRRWLSRKVGWRVEAQVYEYHSLDLNRARSLLERDVDQLPLTLAYAVLMRIANSIDEYLDAGVLHAADPAATLARIDAQNREWSEVYSRVAALLRADEVFRQLLTLHEESACASLGFSPPVPPIAWNYEFNEGGVAAMRSAAALPAPPAPVHAVPGDSAVRPAVPLIERLRVRCGRELRKYPPSRLEVANEAHLQRARWFGGAVDLITGPVWSYAAVADLSKGKPLHGEAVLRVALAVSEGDLGVGILARGESSEFLCPEQHVTAGTGDVELLFPLEEVTEAGQLVFRSWSRERTRAVIRAIGFWSRQSPRESLHHAL